MAFLILAVVALLARLPAAGAAACGDAAGAATGGPSVRGVGVPGGSAGALHAAATGVAPCARTVVPRTNPPPSNASAAHPVTSNRAKTGQPKAARLLRDLDIVVAPPLTDRTAGLVR